MSALPFLLLSKKPSVCQFHSPVFLFLGPCFSPSPAPASPLLQLPVCRPVLPVSRLFPHSLLQQDGPDLNRWHTDWIACAKEAPELFAALAAAAGPRHPLGVKRRSKQRRVQRPEQRQRFQLALPHMAANSISFLSWDFTPNSPLSQQSDNSMGTLQV